MEIKQGKEVDGYSYTWFDHNESKKDLTINDCETIAVHQSQLKTR